MKCKNCGVDMRLYQNNHCNGTTGCTHGGEVSYALANVILAADAPPPGLPKLVSLVERLERAVADLEQRIAHGYRRSG